VRLICRRLEHQGLIFKQQSVVAGEGLFGAAVPQICAGKAPFLGSFVPFFHDETAAAPVCWMGQGKSDGWL